MLRLIHTYVYTERKKYRLTVKKKNRGKIFCTYEWKFVLLMFLFIFISVCTFEAFWKLKCEDFHKENGPERPKCEKLDSYNSEPEKNPLCVTIQKIEFSIREKFHYFYVEQDSVGVLDAKIIPFPTKFLHSGSLGKFWQNCIHFFFFFYYIHVHVHCMSWMILWAF